MNRELWFAVLIAAAGVVLIIRTLAFGPGSTSAPKPGRVVHYEAPTARDQRTYCEHERPEAPCQIGVWVSCPPECDLYERLVIADMTGHAHRIEAW
ncbi:MAG: hypothetical protein AB7Q29_13515 [Vicinamibacterales bacterium]